jgi:hypothetical protein
MLNTAARGKALCPEVLEAARALELRDLVPQITEIRNSEATAAISTAALALTPAAGDPLADVSRAIPKFAPGVLATREEPDCLRIHEPNSPEIQSQPAACRFPTEDALQLRYRLSVDPTTHEDPSPTRGPPDLEHGSPAREQRSCQGLHSSQDRLKRRLSIFMLWIFVQRVVGGIPSLAAAQEDPDSKNADCR